MEHPFPRAFSVDNLLSIVSKLRTGLTELGCHPGLEADVDSMHRCERAAQVRTLCHPRVRATLETLGIELSGFPD